MDKLFFDNKEYLNENLFVRITGVNGSGGITTFTTSIYDATGGKIQIGLSTTQTAALKPGRHVYDVITTNTSGVMECVVEGMVIVSQAVTRHG